MPKLAKKTVGHKAAPLAARTRKKTPKSPRAQIGQKVRDALGEFGDRLLLLLEELGVFREPEAIPNAADERAGTDRVRRSSDALELVCRRVLEGLRKFERQVSIGVLAAALDLAPRAIAHPLGLLVLRGDVERNGARRGARYCAVRRAVPRAKVKARTKRGARGARSK